MLIRAQFESLDSQLEKYKINNAEQRGTFKAQCVLLANGISKKYKQTRQHGPISRAQLEQFHELTKNNNLVFAEPDKGRGIVVKTMRKD